MKKPKQPRKVPKRPAELVDPRLLYCAAMLHIHGLITDGEREKIHKRMMKAKAAK